MTQVEIQRGKDHSLDKSEAERISAMERTRTRKVFVPRTDIYENEDALIVVAEMPGVDEKAVDIKVDRKVLTITGRVADEQIEDHSLVYTEYETGDYERSFTLTDEVDIAKIEASMKQGLLRITLPKAQEAKPRKIMVKAE